MVRYISSYIEISADQELIQELEVFLFSVLQDRFPFLCVAKGYGILQLCNDKIESSEDSIDYYSIFLDEYHLDLHKFGNMRVIFYITYSYDESYECNLEFPALHRLTKYLDNFCVSCYSYTTDVSMN